MLSSLLKLLILSDARIKRQIDLNVGRLIDTGSCKGLRHKLSLPVHVKGHVLMLVLSVPSA